MLPSICLSVYLSIYASIQFYTSIKCIVKTWSKPAHSITKLQNGPVGPFPQTPADLHCNGFDPSIIPWTLPFKAAHGFLRQTKRRPQASLACSMQRRKTLAKHLKIYKHMDHMAVLAVPKKWGMYPTYQCHAPCSMAKLGKKNICLVLGGFSNHVRLLRNIDLKIWFCNERHHLKM